MVEIFASNIIKMLMTSGYEYTDFNIKNKSNKKYITNKRKYIIGFIDGESLTVDEIIKIKDDNYNLLTSIDNNVYYLFIQVILFNKYPDQDQKKLLKNLYKKVPGEKRYLVTASLNVSNKKLNYYFNRSEINEDFFKEFKRLLKYDIINLSDDDIRRFKDRNTLEIVKVKPYITYSIIFINVILSIMLFLLTINTIHKYSWTFNEVCLSDLGAKFSANIKQGEYWRFITPMFLYAGILHSLVNLIAILLFGKLVEMTFDRLKVVIICIISGVVGVVASNCFLPLNTTVAGSGVIFGLVGVLAYLYKKYEYKIAKRNLILIIVVILFNVILGFTSENIDNWTHAGGFLGGILSAHFLGPRTKANIRVITNK